MKTMKRIDYIRAFLAAKNAMAKELESRGLHCAFGNGITDRIGIYIGEPPFHTFIAEYIEPKFTFLETNHTGDYEIEAFVNSLLLASTEGRELMTLEDAETNIREWKAEAWDDIPEKLTPEILMNKWNYAVRRERAAQKGE